MQTDDPDSPRADQPPGPAEPAGMYGRIFGVGDFPRQLNRFSWGAFLLPFFWGIAHGSWPVLTAWVVGTTSPFLFASLLGVDATKPVIATFIAAEVLSEIVAGIARLWAGANAYRLLWKRDSALTSLGHAPKRGAVGPFLTKQRTWTVVGSIVMVVVVAATIQLSADFWSEYGLSIVGPAMSVGWLVAEVGLGVWLGRQMRAEGAAEPAV